MSSTLFSMEYVWLLTSSLAWPAMWSLNMFSLCTVCSFILGDSFKIRTSKKVQENITEKITKLERGKVYLKLMSANSVANVRLVSVADFVSFSFKRKTLSITDVHRQNVLKTLAGQSTMIMYRVSSCPWFKKI